MKPTIHFAPKQIVVLSSFRDSQFDVRFCLSDEDKAQSYALRLKAYRSIVGDELPETGEYKDQFDELSSTVHIAAFDGSRMVGTMRLCFSPRGELLASLPCASHYPALKIVKAQSHGSLMEVSRVSIDPAIANTSYRTTLYASLVRIGLIAAEAGGVSNLLIATRPDWVRFYTYMLGFQQIGEPAFYPPGNFKITLLGGTIEQARLRQCMQNAFFKITREEIASMRHALRELVKLSDAA